MCLTCTKLTKANYYYSRCGTCVILVNKYGLFWTYDFMKKHMPRLCLKIYKNFNSYLENETHTSLLLTKLNFFELMIWRRETYLTFVKNLIFFNLIFRVRHVVLGWGTCWQNSIFLKLWFWRWGTCLIFVEFFFLNLSFLDEVHASPLLIKHNFCDSWFLG